MFKIYSISYFLVSWKVSKRRRRSCLIMKLGLCTFCMKKHLHHQINDNCRRRWWINTWYRQLDRGLICRAIDYQGLGPFLFSFFFLFFLKKKNSANKIIILKLGRPSPLFYRVPTQHFQGETKLHGRQQVSCTGQEIPLINY